LLEIYILLEIILICFCFVLFFSRSEGFRKVPYHYYEPGRDECEEYFLHENAPYGGHRFITEKKVFAKWAKKHTIIFTHPNWTVS
ncbi:SIA7C sialyltransferase, partial [Amazona guildingii]|nr:SIA7C sialyltransferase [Amazona guildingii]